MPPKRLCISASDQQPLALIGLAYFRSLDNLWNLDRDAVVSQPRLRPELIQLDLNDGDQVVNWHRLEIRLRKKFVKPGEIIESEVSLIAVLPFPAVKDPSRQGGAIKLRGVLLPCVVA